MTDSSSNPQTKSPSPSKSSTQSSASQKRSELDRRITRLAVKYRESPGPQTARAFASAVYPVVFPACYDFGGGLAVVAQSVKAATEEVFEGLDSVVSEPQPTVWIRRTAQRLAARNRLSISNGPGGVGASQEPTGRLAPEVTGPELSSEAKRGISILIEAVRSGDRSLTPTAREALDSLPVLLEVALILATTSDLGLEEIGMLVSAETGSSGERQDAASLVSTAAVAFFEHLGQVVADE
jgi:hypothetical protein